MRKKLYRLLAVSFIAQMAFVGITAAQDQRTRVLTADNVRALIARGEPADHARLGLHFAALAEQYAAEARQHEASGKAYAGNTKLAHIAAAQAAHCRTLAERSRAAAQAFEELATAHTKAAKGAAPASLPEQTGHPAQSAAGREMPRLAAAVDSKGDHLTLAKHFDDLGARYEREAAEHTAYAKSWRATTKIASAAAIAAHCDRAAAELLNLAREARATAAVHKEQADSAK
jgi:hypothetical protein